MQLWNFRTQAFDTVVTITDANAQDYYPRNFILDNLYQIGRDAGEQPIQMLNLILQKVTWPQVG